MGTLTWGHPLFLWGLSLLAVPIVLHLMNRELPRRVVFPTIKFILKGRELQQGRRSLRDLATLLARCALLAAVVLLLADPRLRSEPQAAKKGGEEVVFFVDASLSLAAVDYSRWLRERSSQLMEQHPDAVFGLIVSGSGMQTSLPLGSAPGLIADTLAQLSPSSQPGRHEDAWRALAAAYSDKAEISRTAYLFSDFQRSDWAGFRTMAPSIPAALQPVVPPDRPTANLAVLGAATDLQSRGETRRLRVTAQVHNYDLLPRTVPVQLSAGERSTSASVEIGGQTTATVVLEMENPDGNRAEVRLPADPYPWDDAWHLWIGPRPPLSVAVVAGEPRMQTMDLFFLRKALNTNLPAYDRIEARFFDRAFITDQNPHAYSRLILLDATFDLTDLEADVLKAYLEGGGEIILFGGRQYAESIASLNRVGLLRSRFIGRRGLNTSSQTVSIARMRPGTDMLAIFEREPSDLFLFPIAKYARLDPAENAQTYLYLPEDQPFLLREPSGKGGISVFTVSLNPDWSEFPTSLAFLPLLRRLIESGSAGSDASGIIHAEVGEDLRPRLERYDLALPADLPSAPGITIVDNRPIVINSSRAESDPDALTELDWIGIRSRADGPARSVARAAGLAPGQERSLRTLVAVLALALVFAELGLANLK